MCLYNMCLFDISKLTWRANEGASEAAVAPPSE